MSNFDLPLTLAAATLLPIVLGALVGLRFWRRRRVILGNVVASAAVGAVILFLIAQTFGMFFSCSVDVDPSCGTQATLDFATRVLIGLALVGWVDVFVLMILGGVIDDRARKRSVRMEDL
ncbi:MAG: hypothetical protein NTZ50_05910 [Chloroflexi bacterium]|nr:hypothetical protein [Chloroflexota bacterium]